MPVEYHDLGEAFRKGWALSLPLYQPYDCAIDLLPGATLPSGWLYNLSCLEKEAKEKYINFLLLKKTPLLLGPYKLFRCIVYWGLNSITIKNMYSLPLHNSAFEPLHMLTIFTKLDLQNPYHLVRIKEGDKLKITFNTPLGHFEFLVMPFSLTNTPAVFQAQVNDILHGLLPLHVP